MHTCLSTHVYTHWSHTHSKLTDMCTIKQYRFSLVRNVERSISNKMDTFCCEGNVHFFILLRKNVSAVSSKVGELLVCILVTAINYIDIDDTYR